MNKKIVVYTSETCPYCNTIKETLEKNDIKFTEKLISEYKKEWSDISSLTNMSQTPTIIINNEYFVPGRDFFNPEHLINIIKEFKESKFDYSIRSFERIKSLNFNILTAFNRLDTTLRNIETKLNKEENEHKSTN